MHDNMNDKTEWQGIGKAIAEASAACDATCAEHVEALVLHAERTRSAYEAFAACRRAWLDGSGAPLAALTQYWRRAEAVREAEALLSDMAAAVDEADRHLRMVMRAEYDSQPIGWEATGDVKISEAYYMPKGGEK